MEKLERQSKLNSKNPSILQNCKFTSNHKSQHLGNTRTDFRSRQSLLPFQSHIIKPEVWSKLNIYTDQFKAKATVLCAAHSKRLMTTCWKTSPSSAEVSVRKHKRGHQGPEVEGQADPAGADLHPHGRHGALHDLVFSVGSDEQWTRSERSQCYKKVGTYRGISQEQQITDTYWYQLVRVIMMYREARKRLKWKKE